MSKYFFKALFRYHALSIERMRKFAVRQQLNIFNRWLRQMRTTAFGDEYGLHTLQLSSKKLLPHTYTQFQQLLPVQDYEQISPYVERIFQGESNVLWPGRPLYFAKTSGTTSGAKFIPITRESLSRQIAAARYTLISYALHSGNYSFLRNKLIFLTGSPELDRSRLIPVGRLSGIINHHIPKMFRRQQKPSWQANIIEDWETKLAAIVEETKEANMGLISGIPPWILMYFEMLLETTGAKDIGTLFPNLSVLVHGGVNIAPYLPILQKYLGREIPLLETFPASEGFIAFEDSFGEDGLLLNTNGGIFFEFLPVAQVGNNTVRRYALWEVEIGVQYALVLNTNAGLAGYLLGDTVRFVSLNPYKIVITGRIGQFLSTFGEHIIIEEVERAIQALMRQFDCEILEFTVTPLVAKEGQSCYEWYIEFAKEKTVSLSKIAEFLDEKLRSQNSYYDDLRRGNILRLSQIYQVQTGAFRDYMKSLGKLGGQNKLPRLKSERDIALYLQKFVIETSLSF